MKRLVVIGLIWSFWTFQGVFAQDTFPKPKPPTYDLELGAINDSWGGGFTKIEDDARSFGLYVNFNRNQRWGLSTLYSGITDKHWTDTNLASRIDEWLIEGYFNVLKNKWGWLQAGIIGGVVVSGNLGGEELQEATHKLFGVPSVILPYSSFRGVFAHTGIRIKTEPLVFGYSQKFFYAFEPSLRSTWAIDYQHMTEVRLPVGIYNYNLDKLALEFFYRYTENYTQDVALNNLAEKESSFGLGLNRQAGGTRLFWNAYLNSDYSVGGLALYFQSERERKPFEDADIVLEFGVFSDGLGYYNKYHWNGTELAPSRLKFSFQHFYGTYLSQYLVDYPDVQGHYAQTELGAYVQAFEPKPKIQFNPKAGLNLGYKREFYYAGRDRTVSQLTAEGLMLHAEAGITASLPASFLSQNNLYGLNLTYNYNFSLSESQGQLLGRPKSLLPSYGWISFGFVVQMDL